MNEVLKVIADRCSTRSYTEEKLTKEEIEQIITAGLQAPTAANRQEIHISVIDGSNPNLRELNQATDARRNVTGSTHNFYYDAPTVFFLSGPAASPYWSTLDAGIAVENMTLAAESLGLGTLIIGWVLEDMIGEQKEYWNAKFGIPENCEFKICLAVGHQLKGKTPHTFDYTKSVTHLD